MNHYQLFHPTSNMKSFFLLLTCGIQKNIKVANKLSKLSGIKEAVPVYGTYDCIVKTEEMNSDRIKELVDSWVRPMAGVHATLTLSSTSQIVVN